jgi:hypothetical protein
MINRLAMYSANKLKLGLFGANCSNYGDELPYFAAEVLPRLTRPGVAREALVRSVND